MFFTLPLLSMMILTGIGLNLRSARTGSTLLTTFSGVA